MEKKMLVTTLMKHGNMEDKDVEAMNIDKENICTWKRFNKRNDNTCVMEHHSQSQTKWCIQMEKRGLNC